MKYIKVNYLKNVSTSFWIAGNNVFYADTNLYPNINFFKNQKLLIEHYNSFNFLNNTFFISNVKSLTYAFEDMIDDTNLIFSDSTIGLAKFESKFTILTKRDSKIVKYLFNLETQEIIKEIKKLDYWLNLEECINIDFERGNYLVTKENLDTHEIIWSYDLRDLDKFKYMGEEAFDSCLKIIGNTTNELWLATKANRLLVLDLHSGEMIHLFEFEPYGYYAPTARFASLVNDTIVMFHGSMSIIDCKTKAILTYKTPMDLGDDFSNFEVEDASQVQGDYVTFIATKKGSQHMKTLIGIFDYKNQKLAWLHEFPHDEKVSISNPPVIEGNRLYALSYGHVLHVFEKEENQ